MTVEIDKRHAILMAAEELAKHHRFHEITLDQIARRAGIGKGTIYLYFQNKEDVFFNLATYGFEALCETIEAAAAAEGDFAERLVGVCLAISAFHSERRSLLRIMNEEEGRQQELQWAMRKQMCATRVSVVTALEKLLQDGIKRGHIRADQPPDVLGHMLLGMMRVRDTKFDAATQSTPSIQAVVDIFLHGAGAGTD